MPTLRRGKNGCHRNDLPFVVVMCGGVQLVATRCHRVKAHSVGIVPRRGATRSPPTAALYPMNPRREAVGCARRGPAQTPKA